VIVRRDIFDVILAYEIDMAALLLIFGREAVVFGHCLHPP
jgi:hypothetical protein